MTELKNDFFANEFDALEKAQNLVELTPINFDEITEHTTPPGFMELGKEAPPAPINPQQPQQPTQGATLTQSPMQQSELNLGEILPPEMIGDLINATAPPIVSKVAKKYGQINIPVNSLRLDEYEKQLIGKTGHDYLKTLQLKANPLQVFVGVVVFIFGTKVISAMSDQKIETPETLQKAVRLRPKKTTQQGAQKTVRKNRPSGLTYKKSKIPQ
jgi:hypothetical protein